MTNNKRIISFILSLVLVFSVFSSALSVHTFAAGNPALSAEAKTVRAGEQFTVTVSLANATSVYGGNFTLQYDSSLLTVDSYTFGSIVSGHTKNCNLDYQSAGNLIRVTFSGASALASSGALVTFTFTAKENISGSATLKFNAYKMYDENGTSITSSANGSTITIASESVVFPTISITSKTVNIGETISVPVVISNSEDVYGGNFTLQYDSSLLTVESYSFGNIISGHTKNCNLDYQSAGNLIRFTFSGSEAVSSDGTLVTFTFTAKAEGTAELKFNAYKMYDENGSSIITTISNGNVVIEEDNTDTVKPTGSITSTNNTSSSQTVTLKLSDNIGVAGYYWGTSSTYSNSTYTNTSSSSVTKTISSAGTYYLVVKDTSGNVSSSYSVTFYKTTLNANGGSVSPSYILTKSGNTVTLPTPTKSGASFVGWGTSSTATSGVNSITPTSNKTYYAVWEETESVVITGQCGDDVYYELNVDTMLLNIYGTGYMWSYEHMETPWEEYQENICKITINTGVTSIGTFAFSGFSSLTDIEIAESVLDINGGAFRSCTSLTEIILPEGVEYLRQYVFSNCTKLQSIYIPSTVKNISDDSFGDLIGLQEIIVSEDNMNYYSLEGVLYGNGKLYKYPTASENISFTIPNGIHTVCYRAFSYSNNLVNIDLNSVATIQSAAFRGCKSIEFVDTSNCSIIEGYAFAECSGLKQVELPTSITIINSHMFYGCTNLERINFPDNLTKIGSSAFYGCNNLTDLTLPEKLTFVDDLAFRCSKLRDVTVLSNNIEFGENVFGYVNNGNFVGSKDLLLISYLNSPTEQYAKLNDIPFFVIGQVKSICINTVPTKDIYYTGDSLNTSGLSLIVTYIDGSTEAITSGFTTSGFSSTTAGTKTVTVSYEGKTTTFNVTVNTPSITLSSSSKSMYVGDSSTNTATTTPSGQTVTWTSSNASVATVSNGTITAKSAGTATITAKFTYNGTAYSKTCIVTVKDAEDNTDTINPTGSISSTNNVASSQTITLNLSDNDGVAGYYWGTSSTYSNNTYKSAPDAYRVEMNISSSGTYYLVVKDLSGNVSSSYSITFYKTALDANGGSVSPSYILTKSGNTVTLPTPTMSGAAFVGWGTSSSSTSGVKSITPTSNKTYYAVWDYNPVHTHTSGNWIIDKNATCTSSGSKHTECTSCGEVIETVAIPASGHNSSNWIIDRNATCTTSGSKHKECNNCGEIIDTSVIVSTGHTLSNWIIDRNSTCTASGSKHKECTVCGVTVETAAISAKGHTTVKDAAVPATCTKSGKTEGSHCSVCNAVIKAQTTIPAKGHTASDWIVDIQATASASGSKHKECTVCDEVLETATISQLKPATPKVATTNAIGGVEISWNKVSGATKYVVYRRQGGYSTWVNVGTTTGSTIIDKNVTSGIYYVYSVRAYNSSGAYSDFVSANTQTRKYMAVPKLTGISNATNGLYIKWNAVPGVTNGYRVYRRGAGSTYWKYLGTVKTTYYTDPEVKNNSGEYFRYTVIADGGYHSKFDTTGLYLRRLANPTLTSAVSSKSGITVKWSAIKGTTGYYVYRKTANSTWVRVAAVGGTNNTTFLDKTAKKGTTYTYTVRAVCGNVTSSYNSGISCYDKY